MVENCHSATGQWECTLPPWLSYATDETTRSYPQQRQLSAPGLLPRETHQALLPLLFFHEAHLRHHRAHLLPGHLQEKDGDKLVLAGSKETPSSNSRSQQSKPLQSFIHRRRQLPHTPNTKSYETTHSLFPTFHFEAGLYLSPLSAAFVSPFYRLSGGF